MNVDDFMRQIGCVYLELASGGKTSRFAVLNPDDDRWAWRVAVVE